MSQNALSQINPEDAGIAAEAAVKGDLQALSPEQRTALYGATCRSMGLNPLSRPFEYIKLNNRLTLYATRTATDQLRKINGVSITKVEKDIHDGVLTVTVHATDASGRTDMEIGAVTVAGLRGEALANAHMKALTKAKRRVTLSISGLGWLDESEMSSVPSAATVTVDADTGEIVTLPHRTQVAVQVPGDPRTASVAAVPPAPIRDEARNQARTDGKAIHFRGRISELTEPLGWTEDDLNAAALIDFDTAYMELDGESLETMFRDFETMKKKGDLADYLKQLRVEPDGAIEVEGGSAE